MTTQTLKIFWEAGNLVDLEEDAVKLTLIPDDEKLIQDCVRFLRRTGIAMYVSIKIAGTIDCPKDFRAGTKAVRVTRDGYYVHAQNSMDSSIQLETESVSLEEERSGGLDYTKYNQLIAEFMGLTTYVNEKYPANQHEIIFNQGKHNQYVEASKYHTSWDWLVPVVEKIESLEEGKYQIDILQEGSRACVGCQPFITNTVGNLPEGATKIEAVYKTVIDFINWYNANKPKEVSHAS